VNSKAYLYESMYEIHVVAIQQCVSNKQEPC